VTNSIAKATNSITKTCKIVQEGSIVASEADAKYWG